MVYTTQIYAVRLPTLNQARQGQFHTTKARVCGYGRTGDGMTNVMKKIITNGTEHKIIFDLTTNRYSNVVN